MKEGKPQSMSGAAVRRVCGQQQLEEVFVAGAYVTQGAAKWMGTAMKKARCGR